MDTPTAGTFAMSRFGGQTSRIRQAIIWSATSELPVFSARKRTVLIEVC